MGDDPGVNPVVATVTRDGFVEATHRGRVVALDADGRDVVVVGDVDAPVLLRSCAKPLQAAALVAVGLDVPGDQLAIACASHDGTDAHVAVVRSLLAGAGLDEAALANTPALPLEATAAATALLGEGPTSLRQNCSGKHAAMLATCVANGWPLDGYLDPGHPVQVAVLAGVAELAGEPIAHVATDGCGAPIAAVSLRGLARAYARLPSLVVEAMRAHPVLVGGESREITRLMRAVPGLVAKDGAEGCYAAALPDGRSIAVKVDDGSMRACLPVTVAALARLGVDAGTTSTELPGGSVVAADLGDVAHA